MRVGSGCRNWEYSPVTFIDRAQIDVTCEMLQSVLSADHMTCRTNGGIRPSMTSSASSSSSSDPLTHHQSEEWKSFCHKDPNWHHMMRTKVCGQHKDQLWRPLVWTSKTRWRRWSKTCLWPLTPISRRTNCPEADLIRRWGFPASVWGKRELTDWEEDEEQTDEEGRAAEV